MTAERFRRQRDWFDRALDVDPGQRAALIEDCRAQDPDIADDVALLLETHARIDRARTAPALGLAAHALDAAGGPAMGSRAGPYRLEEMIGSGGMGRVFRARRADGLIEQEVAIKLLRRESLNPALLRRFSVERQVLASLDHPGIARLLDAAMLEDGTPYVVMELVRGAPLLAWCDARRLSIDERLRLFLRVLDAVAHAHRSLVVHRDLKSSNILVDAQSQPKLLDFGIAKPISAGPWDATATAERFFTPSSAAPEQIRADPVTVGVDIYALGVLLYEVLCGHPPFEVDSLSPGEIEHLILNVPPPAMSSRVGDADLAIEWARALNGPKALRRRLRGDLDAVVERCLRKDPWERYTSVEQFAADIRNYLAGNPVAARAGRRWYGVRKYLRRNLHVIAGATAAVLIIGGALGVIVRQSVEVVVERDRATLERDRALQATNLLKHAFEAADPGNTGGAQVTARAILTAARPELERARGPQPELYVDLAHTIAEVELGLGQWREAQDLAQGAARVAAEAGLEPQRQADLLVLAARAALRASDHGAAKAALDAARALAPPTLDLRATEGVLLAHQGRYEQSAELLRSVAQALATEPPGNDLALRVRHALADTLRLAGRDAESLDVLDATQAWQLAVLPDWHPDVAHTRTRRADLLHRLRRAPEAVWEARLALLAHERAYGARSTAAAAAHAALGDALGESGDVAAAVRHHETAAALWRDLLGGGNPQTLQAQFKLAQAYGRAPGLTTPARLEALYRETLELGLAAFGASHPHAAAFRLGYADHLLANARDAESLALLTAAQVDEALAAADAPLQEAYVRSVSRAMGRLGCRTAGSAGGGLDPADVSELLALARSARCVVETRTRERSSATTPAG